MSSVKLLRLASIFIVIMYVCLIAVILCGELEQRKAECSLGKLEQQRQVLIIQRRIEIQKFENLIQAVRLGR